MVPIGQAKCLEPNLRSMNLSESNEEDQVTTPKQESRNHSKYSLRVVFKVPKKSKHSNSDEEEKARQIALPQSSSITQSIETSSPESSDSEEEKSMNFLEKRAKNIQANKAMKPKRPPRASLANQEVRKNPERGSRHQTQSMGGVEPLSPEKDQRQRLMKSLEYDLLEEEEAPKKRYFRPSALTITHVVRPVSEITQEELDNIASVRDKIYHSVHDWQCPPCRGICNCSFCRQRDGRCATGILFPLARYHGFKDVHSYLKSLRYKADSDE